VEVKQAAFLQHPEENYIKTASKSNKINTII
jgi:hypothetical protein